MAAPPFPPMLTLLLFAALAMASHGGAFRRVLTLQRAFPLGETLDLEAVKARDRARHARNLQSFSGGVVNFSVRGTADPYAAGLYYTKVRLGSPPQEFNVQIDTGSDILWVACSSCALCPRNSGLGIPLNFFDVAASSTVSPITCSDNLCSSLFQIASVECSTESNECGYSYGYGDGSGTAGFYVADVLYFDTILATSLTVNYSASIVFGCSTSLSGDLTKSERAVDGIFGFGQKGYSVISQLSSHGIAPKVFSHCLKGEGGDGGGILVLGEILDPNIVYTPLVPSQPHYTLYLQSIAVNGQLLPIDQAVFTTSEKQGTIVDSGTTLAYLVEGAYDPFVTAITASVSSSVKTVVHKGDQCYLLSTSNVAETFPPVALNFAGGASMVLRPVDYLVHKGFMDGSSMWCIGFIKVQNPGTTILGDLILKDKIVVYDLAHQRIGWADHDCSIPVTVSLTSGEDKFVNSGQLGVSSSSSTTELCNIMHSIYYALILHLLILLGTLFL